MEDEGPVKKKQRMAVSVRKLGPRAQADRADEIIAPDVWLHHIIPVLGCQDVDARALLRTSRWFYHTIPTSVTRLPRCWDTSGLFAAPARLKWTSVEEIVIHRLAPCRTLQRWCKLRRVVISGREDDCNALILRYLPTSVEEIIFEGCGLVGRERKYYDQVGHTVRLLSLGYGMQLPLGSWDLDSRILEDANTLLLAIKDIRNAEISLIGTWRNAALLDYSKRLHTQEAFDCLVYTICHSRKLLQRVTIEARFGELGDLVHAVTDRAVPQLWRRHAYPLPLNWVQHVARDRKRNTEMITFERSD